MYSWSTIGACDLSKKHWDFMGFIVYDSQVGEHNWGGPHCICDMDFVVLLYEVYGVQW